ncbi:MAG: hypothetical protein HKN23_08690 [Verrucomicrobiales bacterium]|nr:hypothetical protein [Verrucomicrobiales bacterium]
MRHLRGFFAVLLPLLNGLGFLAVWLCFINRWDSLVWVTLIPVWAWAGLGFLFSLGSWLAIRGKIPIILAVAWFTIGLSFSDESRAFGRELLSLFGEENSPAARLSPEQRENKIRVISINCRDESLDAARESLLFEPDIVFLQESPPLEELRPLLADLFEGTGSITSFRRNVILARGRFLYPARPLKGASAGTATCYTRLQLPDGEVLDLANLHLERSITRLDIWKSETRERLTRARVINRRRLRHLLSNPEFRETSHPLLIGGDFGTPPGDDIFRMLKNAGLSDAFVTAGGSNGSTYPAHFPQIRIDQFWHSDSVVPLEISTQKSAHSDHRMVILDFVLSEEGPR